MNRLSQTLPAQFDTSFSPFVTGEFENALNDISSKGLTGVELAVAYPDRADAERILMHLETRGLACTTLSTGQIYGLDGIFLCSPGEIVRTRAASVLRGHIDLSAKLGFPPVTVGLIRGKMEKGDKVQLMNNFREALLPCIDYAEKRGVVLQIEAINKDETVLINSTYEALDFLDSLGNPKCVGILYDTYHSNIEDGDMLAAIRAAAGRITNVHLADSNRGLPGWGTIDFPTVCAEILKTGYTGAFALETLSLPSADFVKKYYAISIRRATGLAL